MSSPPRLLFAPRLLGVLIALIVCFSSLYLLRDHIPTTIKASSDSFTPDHHDFTTTHEYPYTDFETTPDHPFVDLETMPGPAPTNSISEADTASLDGDDGDDGEEVIDHAMLELPDIFTPNNVLDLDHRYSSSDDSSTLDKLVVVAHYRENLDWLEQVPTAWKVIDKDNSRNPDNMNSNNYTEASSYLYFLIKYYDVLPQKIAFVHGHGEPEVMRSSLSVDDTTRDDTDDPSQTADGGGEIWQEGIVWEGIGYHPVNFRGSDATVNTQHRREGGHLIWFGDRNARPETGGFTPHEKDEDDYFLGFYELWDFLELPRALGGMGMCLPRLIVSKCCSTFVVDRDTVRRVPREMLVRLLKYFEGGRRKSAGVGAEYMWTVLFNQARWI